MTGKQILLLAGDFVEDYEIMVAEQALEAVGHTVHTACPEKAAGEKVKTAIHDFRGDQTYMEVRGHDFELSHTFEEIDPAEYDAFIVPGGRAPEYLRTYEGVLEATRHFFEADKPVGAICHGPQVLAAAGVLEGREITSYPPVRSEVEAAGCTWVDGVVRDGNLLTGRNWSDLSDWLAEFLEMLGTQVEHGRHEPAAAD
jgi:protease I